MRILILRTSALGDIVHALPVLSALRRELPEARIGWVVEEAFAELLEGHPDLDRLIVVRTRSWRRRQGASTTAREVVSAVRQMRSFAPTVALDLMGNHKAGVLAFLSGARRRLGPRRQQRREPSSAIWMRSEIVPVGTHVVDRNLSLLRGLAIRPGAVDFAPERLLGPAGSTASRTAEDVAGRVLLHPGAGWGNKRWPTSRWGRLGAVLASEGRGVVVGYGPGEDGLAREVVAAAEGAVESLALPGLKTLATAQRRARLVVAGDTGPLHLAHALGTPVVAIMGPTDPKSHGPYGAPERAVWRRLPCSFCHRRFGETKACLLEVTPEMVHQRIRQVLADPE